MGYRNRKELYQKEKNNTCEQLKYPHNTKYCTKSWDVESRLRGQCVVETVEC